jgi:hypothetical protein
MLDGTGGSRREPATFARACGDVVGGILSRWTGRPRIATQWLSVEQFLRSHVLDQMARGGRLHELSLRYADDEIDVPGEPGPMSSPFALARGTHAASTAMIPALVGRCHGDLHGDNVLIQVKPVIDGTRFHLVDLPLSEPDDPVTRDPVHLVLYILARRMDVISPAQQSALIDVLIAGAGADAGLLPGWLAELIREVNGASMAWLKGSGLQSEWRRQRLLSLVGCAMLFLGRTSTRPEDKSWFLRLAARATAAFLDATPVSRCGPALGECTLTLSSASRTRGVP